MTNKKEKASEVKTASVKPKELELLNQPTSHTDGIHIGCRQDGSVFLQLFSDAPDRLIENHRTMMSKEVVEKVIEVLCETLDFYPEKPSKKAPAN